MKYVFCISSLYVSSFTLFIPLVVAAQIVLSLTTGEREMLDNYVTNIFLNRVMLTTCS